MALTRRSALRLSSVALGGCLTGCTTSVAPSDDSDTSSPTDSPTESPSQSPELAFSAEMRQQASADAPARLTARLSNTGSTVVEVGFGPTLLFTDNSASDDLDWADFLVLDPETDVGPWDDPEQAEDGCWRFPKDGQRLVQSSLKWRTLASDESISETYAVYTSGDSSSCLPEGTYRFQDKGTVRDEPLSMVLTLVLDVDENRRLTASTAEPAYSSE